MLRFLLRVAFGLAAVVVVCLGIFWLLVAAGAWDSFIEGWQIATRDGMPWD